MSAVTIASQAECADQYFLRWSDNPELPVQEEPVEIVGSDFSEPIIRSALQINEETKVFLIGKNYSENGIVRSCRKDGDSFLLTIRINPQYTMPELLPQYDPGLFAVDDFLTEEEEAKILESLKGDSPVLRESSDFGEKRPGVLRRTWTRLRCWHPLIDPVHKLRMSPAFP